VGELGEHDQLHVAERPVADDRTVDHAEHMPDAIGNLGTGERVGKVRLAGGGKVTQHAVNISAGDSSFDSETSAPPTLACASDSVPHHSHEPNLGIAIAALPLARQFCPTSGRCSMLAIHRILYPTDYSDEMDQLRDQLDKIAPDDPQIEVAHRLEQGDAVRELIRVAGEERADLIVMATHGRGGVSRLLMGSVAEGVMRKAPCPVLTMRPGASAPVDQSLEQELVHAY
jgi:nucleotide-binding universal stress UspA family protein